MNGAAEASLGIFVKRAVSKFQQGSDTFSAELLDSFIARGLAW